jgi:hypothetical protein
VLSSAEGFCPASDAPWYLRKSWLDVWKRILTRSSGAIAVLA